MSEKVDKLEVEEGGQSPIMKILPWIIAGIFFVLAVIFIILYAVEKSDDDDDEITNPIDSTHFIERKSQIYSDKLLGAAADQGKHDILDSEYFKIPDIYNMKSTSSRQILTHFQTYQETSDISSACAAILMILNHYGNTTLTEKSCMQGLGITDFTDTHATLDDEMMKNFYMSKIATYITNNLGYKVTKTSDLTENDFKDEDTFIAWASKQIKNGDAILIQCNDWAGHHLVLIGTDDLGTSDFTGDDVLIFADSYDTTDHLQDGYSIWGLERFWAMWQETRIETIAASNEEESMGQLIVIHHK